MNINIHNFAGLLSYYQCKASLVTLSRLEKVSLQDACWMSWSHGLSLDYNSLALNLGLSVMYNVSGPIQL